MTGRGGRFLGILAAVMVAALVATAITYATVTLSDIEQGLPRRAELLAREAGKLDREVATLDRALALAAATGTRQDTAAARLAVEFIHARVSTARDLAGALAGDGAATTQVAAVTAGLDGVGALLDPVAERLDAVPDGDTQQGLAARRTAASEALALFTPALSLARDAATVSAEGAARAIDIQAERLGRFRTIAQIVLVLGGASLVLALALLLRERAATGALRQSTERYRQLFEGNAAVMLLVDPQDGRVVEGNAAACAFYGWSKDALRGKPIAEINGLPTKDLMAAIARAVSGDGGVLLARHRRADGSEREVEVLSGPVSVDGRALLLSIIHDVTDGRAAERALADTEHRYRLVVDSTTQGFWFVAPGTGVTLDVNDSLCRMLGYDREEMVGRPLFEFADGPDRALLRAKVDAARRTRHRSYEVTLTRRDGARLLTRFSATSLRDPDGTLRGSFAFIEDITAQRQFETRLEKSEAMLRSVTANVPGMLFQWQQCADGRHGFRWASPRSVEILGLPHTVLERDWTTIGLHPDDAATWERGLRTAAEDGADWTYEGRILRADSGIMWFRAIARPVTVSPAETLFNGIILDITVQKQLEAALEDNRRLLNLALEAGGVGVWRLDLDTMTPWFSDGWKAMLGYPPDGFAHDLGRWKLAIDAEDRAIALARVADFAAGRVRDFDLMQRYRHCDGRWVHVRSRAILRRDEAGRPKELIGAHVDLTREVEARNRLADLAMHNRLILDSTTDGLYGVDGQGCITFVNAACQRLLGYSEEELQGADSHALFHHSRADGSPYPAAECPATAVLAGGPPVVQPEETLWRRDGSALPVSLAVAPMIQEGRRVGAIITFHDTTERMRWKAELERSNAELEQFAYAASHDLQEPLRGVTSYLSLLKRRHAADLPAEAGRYVEEAMEGAMRMTSMIRDLLTYSRVSTRGSRHAPLDAHACAETALGNLRIAMSEAGADVQIEGRLPPVVGDAVQIGSLFQNLVGNAIKYRHPDRPPRVRLRAEVRRDGRVAVTVEDNGIGIPPEFRDRVFLPFQRLHTQGQVAGTGIGLAVCRKVVERHGGTLRVEDAAGGAGSGSRFVFDLPAAEAPAGDADNLHGNAGAEVRA